MCLDYTLAVTMIIPKAGEYIGDGQYNIEASLDNESINAIVRAKSALADTDTVVFKPFINADDELQLEMVFGGNIEHSNKVSFYLPDITTNNLPDEFIEIDISAYHPTLAAKLIEYDFGDETPYEYFAREANIEVSEAKLLMFKQLYGGVYNEYKYIDFFQLIEEYINKLWKEYTTNNFIICPISGHKLSGDIKDINPQKLFNYCLQNLETSTNVCIVWDVIKILKNKKTKIVLYTYDSILLDYNEQDNILEEIKEIFKKYNLKIKITKGDNYDKMIKVI